MLRTMPSRTPQKSGTKLLLFHRVAKEKALKSFGLQGFSLIPA
jgi:hypothetical protein